MTEIYYLIVLPNGIKIMKNKLTLDVIWFTVIWRFKGQYLPDHLSQTVISLLSTGMSDYKGTVATGNNLSPVCQSK